MKREKTTFEDYLSSTSVKTIKNLSRLTGIEESTLNALALGKISLGSYHKAVIKKIIPDVPNEILNPQARELAVVQTTAKGVLPENTHLIQIQAKDLLVGDLLLVAHKPTIAGSHWIVVSSIKEQGRNLLLGVGNDIEITVSKTNLVKVARNNNVKYN